MARSNGMILCMSATVSSWYLNETDMIPSNVQIHSNSNFLYLTNISENNEGKYECKGKTEDGEVFYANVFVIVELPGDLHIPYSFKGALSSSCTLLNY